MKYDMIAAFYVKAKTKKPAYRCPLGEFCPPTLDFFEKNGFSEREDSTPGYLDYRKTVTPEELQEWTGEGYVSEVMDVLYCGKEFGRIEIHAEELDVLDDEGSVPVRGLPICDCFVMFGTTEPLSRVTFMEGDPYSDDGNARKFHIPLKKLKDYFDAMTTLEVIERMRIFGTGQKWSYEQLKDYFEAGIDDAVDLATRVFFGKRDLDGSPEILHTLSVGMSGTDKNGIIVGLLHDVVEDSEVTLEDLSRYGYSDEVIEAVDLLTHRKEVPYMEYVKNIVLSANLTAIGVKIADLNHNIARGEAGGHNELVRKHRTALALVKKGLGMLMEAVDDIERENRQKEE